MLFVVSCFFFKINFYEKFFQEYYQSVKQSRQNVGPDLGPNCLQKSYRQMTIEGNEFMHRFGILKSLLPGHHILADLFMALIYALSKEHEY